MSGYPPKSSEIKKVKLRKMSSTISNPIVRDLSMMMFLVCKRKVFDSVTLARNPIFHSGNRENIWLGVTECLAEW